MEKYTAEVTRVDEYEIEIDQTIWTDEALKAWSETFWEVSNVKGLAKSLSKMLARNGAGTGFIEGFGFIKTLYRDGTEKKQYEKGNWTPVEKYAKGILVRILSEDEDCQSELT